MNDSSIRWVNDDTGEVKVADSSGVSFDPVRVDGEICGWQTCEWEVDLLELALRIMPDVHAALLRAPEGKQLEVTFKVVDR